MASRLRDCVNRQVEAGTIRKQSAEKMIRTAEDLDRGYRAQGMGPDAAAAAAVAEAARIIAGQARQKKIVEAKQIIAWDRVQREVAAHPRGKGAGAMAQLVPDIYETGTASSNWEALKEVILGQYQRRFVTGLQAYRSKAAGLTQDKIGMRNFVRELWGRQTGDGVAATAAKEWGSLFGKDGYAVKRYQRAGGDLPAREDFRIPQYHDEIRIRDAGFEQWADDIRQRLDESTWTRLEAMRAERADDPDMMALLGPARTRDEVLRRIYDNIITALPSQQMMMGGGANNAHRFFIFKGPDEFLEYNAKYGTGDGGLYDLMMGHMETMARDTALIEQLGPKPLATIRKLADDAAGEEAQRRGLSRLNPVQAFTGSKAIIRTYDVLSGRLSGGAMGHIPAFLQGLRNWLTAVKLESAIVSSVPSDTITTAWAARMNGMPVMQTLATAMKGMNPEEALRMGIASQAVMDGGLAGKRYADEVMGRGFSGRVASTVIRAQGMAAFTQRMKNAFMIEMMGFIADNAPRRYGDLDAPMRGMLDRAGITAAEWDVIRAAPMQEVRDGGVTARYFDPEAVADRRIGEKMMQAIIRERGFAILEPGAIVRQITTAGLPANTVMGQVARSAFQFKSFAITMMMTHMMRMVTQTDMRSRLAYGATMMVLLTIGGAVAIQARQIITGKDPRPMDTPEFAVAAMLQGGALGFFGDFAYSATARDGSTMMTAVAGPSATLLFNDVPRLLSGNLRQLIDGEDTGFAAELTRVVKANTPWELPYARLAIERAWWDQIQMLADPDWRQSFRRMERKAKKDFGQEFWWGPGDLAPERAPDLGAALSE